MLNNRPLLAGIAAGLAHALVLTLAFPPLSLGVLGILAPLPLLVLGFQTRHPWKTGLGVAIGTLPFWAYHHWWVFAISAAGAPPLMLLQSLWPGLFVALAALLAQQRLTLGTATALATLWTGLEYFRGHLFFDGYPWFLTAHPTAGLPLARWASILGVYGVGFLIVLLGGFFVVAMHRRADGWKRWIAPAACLGVLAGASLLPSPRTTGSVTVAIVQTDLPQSNKMARTMEERGDDFIAWARLTWQAASADPRPDLIVWPETMFPGPTLSPSAIEKFARFEQEYGRGGSIGTVFIEPLLDLQQQAGIPLLIGAIGYENFRIGLDADAQLDVDFDAMFNSAFVISGGSIQPERYDKMFLTPFGETMPYISRFPRLERAMLDFAARGMDFDLSPGTDAAALEVATPDGVLRVATPICFEATIPHVCRRLVYDSGRRQADVLINMTNDGWFSSFDPGRANHLLIARWRAIELGLPVVRAANTGISCVVDASGRVLASLDARQGDSVLVAEVPLSATDRTIYARIGDAPGWMAFAASLVLLLLRIVNRRPTASASPPHPDPDPSHAP